MARCRCSLRCSVRHISRTRALGGVDCLRRSRSSIRNPPAERRLNKATPKSQASTSQGNALRDRETLDAFRKTLSVRARPGLSLCVSTTVEDSRGADAPDGTKKKNVETGAANIRASVPTATTYRAEARRQRLISTAATAAKGRKSTRLNS